MIEKRYYKRNGKMTISKTGGDILIPSINGEILIIGDMLYVKDMTDVYLEEKRVYDRQNFQNGDRLQFCGILLTFFQSCIVMEGELAQCVFNLPPYPYKEKPFENFPYYKKSPRINRKLHSETIEVKEPPRKESMAKGSLVQIIVPPLCMLGVTVFMSIFMKRGLYVIASICMTLVTSIFSVQRFFSERKEIKQKNSVREQVYSDYLVRLRAHIRKKRQQEREILDYQAPPIEVLERMATGYDSRLYERSMEDEDFLQVMLGYRSGESTVSVHYNNDELRTEEDELQKEAQQTAEDFETIDKIPVTVNLRKEHLGIVGEPKQIHNQLKYLLAQICFFHSYHDLQIVFISNERYAEEFSYLRWYPHMRIQAVNVIAGIYTDSIRDQVLGSILQIVKDRKQKVEESSKGVAFVPHLVFVIDEPRLIQDHAIMEYLGRQSRELAISIIYTTPQLARLPENIKTVCVLDNSETGHLLMEEGVRVNQVFDCIPMDSINTEQMSRSTAAVIHEKGMVSRIPDSITFFEMFHITRPEQLHIASRWKSHEAHKSLAVPLGVREQDNYVELNLHEKAHGPHGLVAGTTGSGKSEIVQSYILSLAVNFHPYEVGFLLIDYKGGGMANLFQNLPHLLGTITNLDGAESYRAMVSIKSELARRQRIFNQYNVNHINGYHQLYKLGKAQEPIPHLFLISDEFAELKKEQPEFMKELVSAARIGRSLGIHLILATQKPSGVVDEQIWTNSKFKLCLKVQNESDSREMIKTPDAAAITQPGRAYLQVGNNEIYELFQSAFSGAPYSEEESEGEERDTRVWLVNELGQGQLINQDLGGSMESNRIRKTQLDVVVDHIAETFAELSLPMIKSPWLPPLGKIMVSPHLQRIEDSASFKELNLSVALGMEDIPGEQRQEEYRIDFLHNGHVILFASTGYGKTVFLATILLSLCACNSVMNLNAYILDFGNNALIALKALPHVADYITYDDLEKQQKLMRLLVQEIKERKQLMADAMVQNFDIYNQSADKKLKAILILLDNYDVVKELGIDENFFVQLARDGANLGIYLAMTASRSSVVKYALMNQIKTKIAGYNYEPMEARNIVGRSEYELPEIKGRTLVKGESINLMQIYAPVDFTTGLEYNQNLQQLIREMTAKSTETKAKGIAVLPGQFTMSMLPEYESGAAADIILGLEKQQVIKLGITTSDTPFLIVGPVRSGKSNAGRVVLKQTRLFEKVYLYDARDYEYQEFASQDNVMYIDSAEAAAGCLEELKDLIEERKEECRTGRGRMSTAEFYRTLEKYCIFINGLSDFAELIRENSDVISTILQAAETGILIVMVGHASHIPARTETAKLVKAAENGLILGEFGGNTAFPTIRGKDLPAVLEDGLLYRKGAGVMIRIPRG
ncbi:MAG: type VII secretion protein EssC [Roseburia sp.]|nr:type VII secretion protein EssC [Roseburia sp.]MCM1242046.1 type VII secretion protein EssC [Roseburia sp.]